MAKKREGVIQPIDNTADNFSADWVLHLTPAGGFWTGFVQGGFTQCSLA